jgi:hypothetical protein
MLMTAQEKIACGLAAETVRVRFNASRPCANVVSREIGLPPMPETVDDETETNTRSWIHHEVGHLLFKSKAWTPEVVKDKILKELCFELEDCRTDRKMGEKYPGTLDSRRRGFDIVRDKLNAPNVLQAALYVLYENVKKYFVLDDSVNYWAARVGEPMAAAVLKTLMMAIADQIDAARATQTTDEVIALAREIKEVWKRYFQDGGDGEGESDEQSDSKMNDGGMFGKSKSKSDEKSKGKQKKSEDDSEDEDGAPSGGSNEDESDDESEGDESEDGESGDGDESEEESQDEGESDDEDESEGDEDGESEGESDESEDESDGDGSGESDDEDGESEDGESDDESDDESDSDESSDDESDSDSSEGSEGDEKKDAEKAMQDMMDDFKSVSDSERDEVESRLSGDGEDEDDYGYNKCPDGYRPFPANDAVITLPPATSGLYREGPSGRYGRNRTPVSPEEFRAEVKSKLGTLQRRLLMDLMSKRRLWITDREHGEIDDTRLYRVPTGDKNVCKRKLRRPALNIAVSVVLDMSGSMMGGKMYLCGQLGYVLGETLALVRVPYEVVGFTTGNGCGSSETPVPGIYYHRNIPLELIEIKPFSMTRRSDMLGRFYAAAAYQGGGTVEGEGVWWAAKRLALRKEQRKLLIVVCDGGPCGGPAPTWKFEEHAGEVVKRIREYGIETIHVGIGTNDPLRYVPEETFVRYDGLDDLLTGFYSRLGSILRGERRRNEEPVPVT